MGLQPVENLPYVMEVCLGPFATQKVVAAVDVLDHKIAANVGTASSLHALTAVERRVLRVAHGQHSRHQPDLWTPFDHMYLG